MSLLLNRERKTIEDTRGKKRRSYQYDVKNEFISNMEM